MTKWKKGVGRIGAALVLSLVMASCITGPVAGPIALSTGFDVAQVGYQRSEFFINLPAHSYSSAVPLTADGKWDVVPDAALAGYKTRIVVYRPINAAEFNGSVIVEWLNVTAGVDLANDWVMAHNELIRSGYAYVGVSAQAVGVNALKGVDPARYGSLFHPGDSFSYDMFTHAGQQVRQNPTILGGLAPQQLIATGESQSASRLVTYINAMHKRTHVFDGYMVHSRGAGASSLRQTPLGSFPAPSPVVIRNDLDVPVMVVQAEGDVVGSNLGARQPDTPLFREWELAGTAHADAYTVVVGFNDLGTGAGADQMFGYMRNPLLLGCEKPVSAGPHYWLLQTAFAGLDNWVRTGVPPVTGPPLQVVSTSPVVFARDAQGNALGGIRSPHVDAPVATLDGVNTGGGFCRLFGSTTPLTTAQLTALYPTHADFVSAWSTALDDAVAAGYILPADVSHLLASAVNSTVPN